MSDPITDPPAVAIIGLGKLGAPMAAALASRGCDVTGVDRDTFVVDQLNEGRAPVEETGLSEMIAANRSRLRATTSMREAIHATDVSFVIVPTPSKPDGGFAVDFVVDAARAIGAALADIDRYHTVALTSTVMPGDTRRAFLAALEASSGRRAGVDLGVCYSPSFIALGSVIHDYLHPDLVLVGEHDTRAGDVLERLFRHVSLASSPIKRMTLENAELAKLAVNTYLTQKITFANMLGEICDASPHADVDVVSDAIGLDSRIGRKYLTAGLGYGGPCFPRDNAAMAALCRSLGLDSALPEATDRMNRTLAARVVRKLVDVYAPTTVAVLGMSYKPASAVLDESQGLAVAEEFAAAGCDVVAYDPLAADGVRDRPGNAVKVVDDLAAVTNVDLLVIANADPAFRALESVDFHPGVIVVDFWGLLDAAALEAGNATLHAFGRSPARFADG